MRGTTYVDLGVIWQRSESLVQRLVHLFGISFEETAASCHMIRSSYLKNEEQITHLQ